MKIEEIVEKIKFSKNMSGIVRILNNDNNLINDINLMTNFLINSTINERLYCIKNDINNLLMCPICNNEKLEWNQKYKKYKNTCGNKLCKSSYFKNNRDINIEINRRQKISDTYKNKSKDEKKLILNKIKNTNIKRYGVDSYAKTNEFKVYMKNTYGYISPFELEKTRLKTKKTLINKYGVDHNFKIDSVQDKRKKTFLINYNTDNPMKNEKIVEKLKKTNNIKYGGNCPLVDKNVYDKSKKTLMNNYNVDYPIKNKKISEKMKNTMLIKYGVEYWIQNTDNFNNLQKRFNYKKYKLCDNREVSLQGYEDYVLFEILLKKYDISDILINNKIINKQVGDLYYTYKDNKHKYYPDFYIVSEKRIIEVKSEYTYNVSIEKNLLKKECCLMNGFKFDFIIINKKMYNDWKKIKKNNYE